jgi:cytochrome c-type biogenesis protein CcmH/NrfF
MTERVRWLLGQSVSPGPEADTEAADRPPSPAEERQATAIARQTMSPFCPGRTLADCPSEYAGEWRRDIQRMLVAGRSPAEIQDELERRAGANLSGIPARDTSYWVPAAFALLGVAVLGTIFVRLRRSAPKAGAPQAAEDSASDADKSTSIDDERLEAELRAEGDDER